MNKILIKLFIYLKKVNFFRPLFDVSTRRQFGRRWATRDDKLKPLQAVPTLPSWPEGDCKGLAPPCWYSHGRHGLRTIAPSDVGRQRPPSNEHRLTMLQRCRRLDAPNRSPNLALRCGSALAGTVQQPSLAEGNSSHHECSWEPRARCPSSWLQAIQFPAENLCIGYANWWTWALLQGLQLVSAIQSPYASQWAETLAGNSTSTS